MVRLLVSCALLFSLGGCGVLLGSSACDFRGGSVNGPEPRCQERVETISAEAFKGACGVAGGQSTTGTCPRAGSVGGCEIGTQGDGSKVNDWYYAPKTREEVQTECSRDSAKFLEP